MFQARLGFVRMTAVAAVSACCLGTVACGGGSTSDPLAGLTGEKVGAEAVANTMSASSLTMDGALSVSGQAFTVNLGFKPGKGCTGTVRENGKGSFKLIVIGTTIYFKPDHKFWKSITGSLPTFAIQVFMGKYLKGQASGSNMSVLANLCDMSKMFEPVAALSAVTTKGQVTTLDGTRVLLLKAPNGSTAYVTDTSKPELVQIFSPEGAKGGSGKLTITVGAPVTLTPPPADQVVDASKVGM